ncbi:secretion protein HlyD [Helicobacter pullorum]|uniref:HlyD family secretion protein n=1 Tax=Helicobacter pullorum TaxID=35818 RepID=UPI0008169F7B|nr:HlyD family secretion protein [Helicobacter pullorum]OCR03294.1 secretion protein HlyD [Helicobacter pullorum]OCR05760.1 secretion protein HlyD [Helicobacter pullorum]OCR11798.1 secretion protein HlyD [Helicobacter pullorum]OCR12049.1 secretion protein HlyD [Helicobacter pullorum]
MKKYSWLPRKPKLFVIVSTIIGMAIGVLLILYAWQLPPFFMNVVATNDAYIQSSTTILSPQVSGYITEIYVKDFETIKEGQPLFQIDKRIFTQRVEEARANLTIAQNALKTCAQDYLLHEANIKEKEAQIKAVEANLQNMQADFKRSKMLIKQQALSKRDYDNAAANLKSTQAQLQQVLQEFESFKTNQTTLEAEVKRAESLLELALIDLDNSLIKAPIAGKLGEIGAKIGQFVSQDTALTYLIPKDIWVIANIKETKMDKVKIGQKVVFSVDALNDKEFSGVVEEISPATGSEFSAIKVNHATGNFIKIVQRIPVKIKIDSNQARLDDLRVGMSVVVEVHTQ